MRTMTLVSALIAVVATLVTGCSQTTGPNPTSPTSLGVTEDVLAEQTSATTLVAPVGVVGVVGRIDVRTRSLTLTVRTGTRLVRTDERTEVWSSGTRVRFTAVRVGMTVGVRAQDYGRFLLARTISIMR